MRRQIDHITLQTAVVGSKHNWLQSSPGWLRSANTSAATLPRMAELATSPPFRNGRMSASALRRIAAAQRARWAAYRAR